MRFTRRASVAVVGLGLLLAGCAASPTGERATQDLPSWERFARMTGGFAAALDVPSFEPTPEELTRSVDETLGQTDAALDEIASQDTAFVSFRSTIAALDDAMYPVGNLARRVSLMRETHPTREMREAATAELRRLQDWSVRVQYREDLYAVCRAFEEAYDAGRKRRMEGEPLKLLRDTMRDYRRAGLHLDPSTRARVEELQKRLASLSTDFSTNINNASVTLHFSREELDGFSDEQVARYATDDGRYAFRATVTPEFVAVMQNATREDTRRLMKTARYSVAQVENIPLLNDIVAIRDEIASLLGYNTWADYKTEPMMAGSGDRALSFIEDMAAGLQPKFEQEVEAMRALKAADIGDPDARIEIWDWRHYQERIMRERFSIDTEQLRNFFEFDACLAGMFRVFEEIFGLRFTQVQPTNAWAEGVTLHVAQDARTGEPLGMFYLDMFPREGKFNHFAQFGIIPGKRLPNGRYQRPVVALVCNFTPPTGDKPSLISHAELQTLFHEFGHALHSILTRAEYAAFSGTSVPRDFVEAPSQMLEAWTWDTGVLDTFAADYRDPSVKIDPDLLARMEEARLATIGVHYRRQFALALGDLRLHGAGSGKDSQAVINRAFDDVFLRVPEGTAMAAYWGHMTGYDASYYGYAWADAIAADMESVFQNAPGGLMDKRIGLRLRNEIYAVGGSREIEESIRAFLGRDRSIEPFLKSIGIDTGRPRADAAAGANK